MPSALLQGLACFVRCSMCKSLKSFFISFLPGVKDRSRGRSRSFVVRAGVRTSSCGSLETRVLLGRRSSIFQNYLLPIVCPCLSFSLVKSRENMCTLANRSRSISACLSWIGHCFLFFRVLLWSGPCLNLEKDQLS